MNFLVAGKGVQRSDLLLAESPDLGEGVGFVLVSGVLDEEGLQGIRPACSNRDIEWRR